MQREIENLNNLIGLLLWEREGGGGDDDDVADDGGVDWEGTAAGLTSAPGSVAGTPRSSAAAAATPRQRQRPAGLLGDPTGGLSVQELLSRVAAGAPIR